MPTPKPNEKQSDYISRCVKEVMNEENTNKEQALGKCYGMFREAKKSETINLLKKVLNIFKARKVGGFESPEPGNLPEAGKKLLARVYAECRKGQMSADKEKCAKEAWAAVHHAGYKSLDKINVEKVFKSIDKLIEISECICKE
jgi:hypothetical protein